MKPKVYIETTIVSYLSASPSRDIVLAAHQQLTREWWAGRERFDLFAPVGSAYRVLEVHVLIVALALDHVAERGLHAATTLTE